MRQERRFVRHGVPAKVAAVATSAWLELAHADEDSQFNYSALVDRAARVFQARWPLECYQLQCVAKALQRLRWRAQRQRAQALVAERCAARCRCDYPFADWARSCKQRASS